MPDNIPIENSERVTCSISAAARYQIPANIVLAIAEKESGRPGHWLRNENGTHDVGSLQFNTAYLATLRPFGITPNDVAAAGCYAYDLAAWRLRRHIQNDAGDLWRRVSNYHSRTPRFNQVYRADIVKLAAKWAAWLEARYPTHEIGLGETAPAQPTPKQAIRAQDKERRDRSPGRGSQSTSTSYVARKLVNRFGG